jgi:hypothetical protein
MEISLDRKQYRIGVLRPDDVVNTNVQASNDDGQLTTELNDFLNPSLATAGNLIPPPSFPSLAEWVFLPYGGVINSVRTRDRFVTPDRGQSIFLVFHPNGFSEFAVFHLTLASRGAVTLVINPFTGRTKLYQGHKEFRWSYGK